MEVQVKAAEGGTRCGGKDEEEGRVVLDRVGYTRHLRYSSRRLTPVPTILLRLSLSYRRARP